MNRSDDAVQSGRRHFYFWCTSCRTVLHVETAEGNDVCSIPDEPPCVVCGGPTRDYDNLAAFGDTPLNDGSWEAFEAWQRRGAE